ncbi:MAG TPA: acyltransferase [Ilumatobacteraceae bacterium]|jgi:peptidoglycan/LPS O-acetylase OafA/YrhL
MTMSRTAMVHATAAPRRLPGLDGLRALAVALVVVHNYRHKVDGRLTSFRGGYIGVTLFFVISGFLITSLLLVEHDQTGRIRVGAFYVRRLYRLLPALILALVLLLVVGRWMGEPFKGQLVIGGSVLGYFFNWWHGAGSLRPGWGPLWSLSVEEQFYLVWPLLLVGFLAVFGRRRQGKDRDDVIAAVIIAAACVLAVWRTIAWTNGLAEAPLYNDTHFRVDALLFGAVLALVLAARPRALLVAGRADRWFIPAVGALLLLAVFGSRADPTVRPGWMLGPGMTVVALVSTIIVLLAISAPDGSTTSRMLGASGPVWLGQRSYAVYLFHGPIAVGLDYAVGHGGAAVAGVSLLLTLLAADLSYRFVEQPVLRRLPRWARRSTPAMDPPIDTALGTGSPAMSENRLEADKM